MVITPVELSTPLLSASWCSVSNPVVKLRRERSSKNGIRNGCKQFEGGGGGGGLGICIVMCKADTTRASRSYIIHKIEHAYWKLSYYQATDILPLV